MMTNIDVIILSNGKNEELVRLTNQTIQSLLASEEDHQIRFEVLVIESNAALHPFQYEHAKTIYPTQKFGFHKYLNIGVNATKNELICFCNNDLIFQKGWASAILSAKNVDPEIHSFSTFCPDFHSGHIEEIPNEINYGYQNGVYFTGWCFLLKRSVFKITGLFDEKFTFYYADDDFRLTLKKYGLKNALINNAVVKHLGSETLNKEQTAERFELQYSANAYYRYKWEHKNLLKYLYQTLRYIFNKWKIKQKAN